MTVFRRANYLLRRLVRRLAKASGSDREIARGVGIGFLVGWLPLMGIQMALSLLVCHFCKANKVVSLLPVWLTNPLTFIPIYSFNYWVGWKLVGGPPLSEVASALKRMVAFPYPDPDAGWMQSWWKETRHALGELLSMGWDMQLPLWLGSVLIGLALAFPSYHLTLFAVRSFREAGTRKKQARQNRRDSAGMVDAPGGDGYTGEDRDDN